MRLLGGALFLFFTLLNVAIAHPVVLNATVAATEFELQVKHDEERCIGKVVIRRPFCPDELLKLKISNDNKTDAMFRALYGPDAFHVQLVGPERFIVHMAYRGQCVYEGQYSMSLPGVHVLDARHIYHSYVAVTEMFDWYIPGRKMWWMWGRYLQRTRGRSFNKPIQASPLMLKCHSPSEDPIVKNFIAKQSKASGDQRLAYSDVRAIQRSKPPCKDLQSMTEGRWVMIRNKTTDWVLLDAASRSSIHREVWRWHPYTCSLKVNWTEEEAYKCMKGKNIKFLGDSQSRVMFWAFVNEFLPDDKRVVDNLKTLTFTFNPTPPGQEQPDLRTAISYQWDPFLDCLDANHTMGVPPTGNVTNHTILASGQQRKIEELEGGGRELDYLFLGYGNWPASSNLGILLKSTIWGIRQYKEHMKEIAKGLRKWKEENRQTKVVWLGMPAFPWPTRMDERRSHERMRVMETMAEVEMAKFGVRTFRTFDMTEAVAHYTIDGGHFVSLPAITMGAALLQVLCQ